MSDISLVRDETILSGKELIDSLSRRIPDFPIKGVEFIDLTPVFADKNAFKAVIDDMISLISQELDLDNVDYIAGIDARGFILAGAIADQLNKGMLAIRKAGKLPPPVTTVSYEIEYGTREIEIPSTGIAYEGKKVLIVDDVLATAGTALATKQLLAKVGAVPVGFIFALEIEPLHGKNRINDLPVVTLSVL